MELTFKFLPEYVSYFINGAKITILLAFFTVLFGTMLGMMICLMKTAKFKVFESTMISKLLNIIASIYVEFVRGTPVLVQIWIIYIALPQVLGFDLSGIGTGIVALSLNSAAYVAEIIRAGIDSVDKGQAEAARSLGMKRALVMAHIIIPQAVKNILPALGNEFITIIKESSIVSVIGVAELMYNTGTVRGTTALGLEPLLVAAVIYFILTFTLTRILGVVERRLKASDLR